MSQRHGLAITAGAATLLASLPMMTIFSSFIWFLYAVMATAVVVGTAIGIRALRGPAWVQVLGMLGGLLLLVTFLYPSGGEIARFIPTGATFVNFNDLLLDAGETIRMSTTPVPDVPGLLMLTTIGIGLVAMLVDLAAVGLRRPALAGLPMLALYSVPVAVIPDGLSVLPFIFAAAGFIWLLVSDSVDRVRRFGRRFTGEGRDIDVWEASPLSSAGRRLGVIGVVVAILLPLAIPGMTSGLIDSWGNSNGLGPGAGPGGGSSSRVDLSGFLQGQLLREDNTVMVRVATNDPDPFYLRIGVADQVSARGFEARAAAGNPLSDLPSGFSAPAGTTANPYHAEIEIADLNMNLAPVYQQLVGVSGLGSSWFYEADTGQVFSRNESVLKRKYSIDYVRVGFSPDALRAAGPLAGNDPVRALAVVPANQFVNSLVSSLTQGRTGQYEQVRAIYDYFTGPTSDFRYSLSTVPGDSGSDIVDFLTAKQGYCVQYAAAMAWLVRAAGYPARVAFGFTRGIGPRGGTYALTNFNLHAWTEVYFPTFGWVPFDATPAGSVVGSIRPAWAPVQGDDTPVPTNLDDDLLPGRPSGDPSAGPTAGPDATDPGAGPPINAWWLVGAAAFALVVTLLLVPAVRRRSLSRQRRAKGGQLIVIGKDGATRPPSVADQYVDDPVAVESARRDAHAAWSELRDTMIDYQVSVDEAETPRVTADRLNALLAPPVAPNLAVSHAVEGDTIGFDEGHKKSAAAKRSRRTPRHATPVQDHTALLARAEERARYARQPLHPHGLDSAVGAVRDAIAERATRRQRLAARLMPRSVLLHWRMAWLTRVARVSTTLSRTNAKLQALNPRRLLVRSPH